MRHRDDFKTAAWMLSTVAESAVALLYRHTLRCYAETSDQTCRDSESGGDEALGECEEQVCCPDAVLRDVERRLATSEQGPVACATNSSCLQAMATAVADGHTGIVTLVDANESETAFPALDHVVGAGATLVEEFTRSASLENYRDTFARRVAAAALFRRTRGGALKRATGMRFDATPSIPATGRDGPPRRATTAARAKSDALSEHCSDPPSQPARPSKTKT